MRLSERDRNPVRRVRWGKRGGERERKGKGGKSETKMKGGGVIEEGARKRSRR